MAKGAVHTVYKDGEWRTTFEGGHGTERQIFKTKEEAVAAGREKAQRLQTEHVIHNQDGSIGERNSYGDDPANRPG